MTFPLPYHYLGGPTADGLPTRIRASDVEDPEKLAKLLEQISRSLGERFDGVQGNFEALAGGVGQPTFRRLRIDTEESLTNTSYSLMTTPDSVKIGIPGEGFIAIAYMAQFKSSVAAAGRAAIHLNGTAITIADGSATPSFLTSMEAATVNGADIYKPVASFYAGLKAPASGTGTNYGGHLTTGQVLGTHVDGGPGSPTLVPWYENASSGPMGGACLVFADPGTYDVEIRYRATSGSVTAKNRRLAVWPVGTAGGAVA